MKFINKINKIEKRYITAFCYILSLLPVFLPWCYFDPEIDGIKYGKDIVNPILLIILAGITIACILFSKNQTAKIITALLLLTHFMIYLYYGLFWYEPLITDFNLHISLETLHYGFYLSLLCSASVSLFYLKAKN